jgi:hypothetical protein
VKPTSSHHPAGGAQPEIIRGSSQEKPMAKKDRKSTLVCPCCGQRRPLDTRVCAACGARHVDEPLAPPAVKLPRLGPAFTALGLALTLIAAFFILWLLSNDMKVARTLLVWMLGDGTPLTRAWLQADPDLPYYRIFSYDAYRLAFYLSFGMIPLAFIGLWLGRRAVKLARRDPARVGGLRLARSSYALSLLLFLSFGAAAVSSIPRAIEQGRARRLAATRAAFYQLHSALNKYYREHGTNPPELADLLRESKERLPQVDYWERAIVYSPGSLIAAKDGPPAFSNYELRSAGPDGILDTADDIIMRDGVIVTAPTEADLPASLLAPEKARK